MLQRVLSSLVGLPLLVLVVLWRGGLPFTVGVGILALAGLTEFYSACSMQGFRPLAWLGYAAAVCFLLEARLAGSPWAGQPLRAALMALVLVGLLVELARAQRAPVRDLGATLLGALYVGWLFSYLVLLRDEGGMFLARMGGSPAVRLPATLADPGAWLVLLVMFATWACDTGAFFTGRAFGRHPLAPAISPGKTVEGAAGGWASALAMALLGGSLLSLDLRLAALLGALIGLLAQLGDLCESALKRDLGIKDFGGLLPGHGGVLDRFDSLLMTAPVVYYLLSFWPR